MLKSKPFRLTTTTRTAEVVTGAQLHITVPNARKIYLMTDPHESNTVDNKLILEWLRTIATRILMTDGDCSSYTDLLKDFNLDYEKAVEPKEADEKGLTSNYVNYVEQAKRDKER